MYLRWEGLCTVSHSSLMWTQSDLSTLWPIGQPKYSRFLLALCLRLSKTEYVIVPLCIFHILEPFVLGGAGHMEEIDITISKELGSNIYHNNK